MIYIVMGVSGCGKSSIGQLLAEKLSGAFYDADDFHTEASKQKMSNGIPLNDDDRQPWLEGLAQNMLEWEKDGDAVLACSALKEKYRVTLSSTLGDEVKFVYLHGTRELIAERLNARAGHFMNPALLDSQFDTLEEPTDAIVVSIDASIEKIVADIVENINA